MSTVGGAASTSARTSSLRSAPSMASCSRRSIRLVRQRIDAKPVLPLQPDPRARAAAIHALHDRAHQHADREQARAGDPLGPARAGLQLHVVARERLELLFLLDVLFRERFVLGLELLHALAER